MKILGISRSPRFSPNSVARDKAIFQAVAGELRRMGHDVATVCEDDFRDTGHADIIYNMGRDTCFLASLARHTGVPVINSPSALLSATRTALTERFGAEGIPIPRSYTFRTATLAPADADAFCESCGNRIWLKRGDACAQSAEDVRHIQDTDSLHTALEDFARRNITDGVLCEHVAGDLVKFYGVEGTDFFYLYYPTEGKNFSKFGLEKINGAPTGFAFRTQALKACADHAARLSGFIVYGGDAIIRRDGSFVIIDFNDWPSFSRCCNEAARAIAARVNILRNALHPVAMQSAFHYL